MPTLRSSIRERRRTANRASRRAAISLLGIGFRSAPTARLSLRSRPAFALRHAGAFVVDCMVILRGSLGNDFGIFGRTSADQLLLQLAVRWAFGGNRWHRVRLSVIGGSRQYLFHRARIAFRVEHVEYLLAVVRLAGLSDGADHAVRGPPDDGVRLVGRAASDIEEHVVKSLERRAFGWRCRSGGRCAARRIVFRSRNVATWWFVFIFRRRNIYVLGEQFARCRGHADRPEKSPLLAHLADCVEFRGNVRILDLLQHRRRKLRVWKLRPASAFFLEANPAAAVLRLALDDRVLAALRATDRTAAVAVFRFHAGAVRGCRSDKRSGGDVSQLACDAVLPMPCRKVDALDVVGRSEPKQHRQLFTAGLEQNLFGSRAGDRSIILALTHHAPHRLAELVHSPGEFRDCQFVVLFLSLNQFSAAHRLATVRSSTAWRPCRLPPARGAFRRGSRVSSRHRQFQLLDLPQKPLALPLREHPDMSLSPLRLHDFSQPTVCRLPVLERGILPPQRIELLMAFVPQLSRLVVSRS